MFRRLPQYGADTGVGVLDERSRVPVEVDGFFRVEGHVLSRVYLQYEIFQRAQADNPGDVLYLLGSHLVGFAQFPGDIPCRVDHLLHQVVRVDHGSLAALHLAIRQFHHAVREVNQPFPEGEAQLIQQDGQNLEVIVLLVADDIDHLVDRVIVEAQFGGTDILGHIDRRAIRAEQQLLVQSLRF